jgi:hypothetical protein
VKHIFVSYAREDRDFAGQVTRRLREFNRSPWQDQRNLRAGRNWQTSIDDALRDAEAIVVVLSPHATRSQYVAYEWAFALGAGVLVIPVLYKHTPLHPKLSTIEYVDFTERPGSPWVQLRNALPGRPSTSRKAPTLCARFSVVDGAPATQNGYYLIRVYTHKAPGNTDQVTYEFHDETLKKRKWSSRAAAAEFESTILSNGDTLITATFRTAGAKPVQVTSSLYDALRRGHGTNPGRSIQRAIRMIEKPRISKRRS